MKKVSEQHVVNIVNHLSENIALTKRGSQEVREVSNSGLKYAKKKKKKKKKKKEKERKR